MIFSLVNSFFNQGFSVIPENDLFYYSLSSVKISHKNGYLYIHATPFFEKIDLLAIAEFGIKALDINITETITDFINTGV